MSHLIVNADDFGLHTAINEGIEKACTQGIVTSTSLMASGGAFDEAVTIAKRHPELGIGVHLTLVGGVSPVSCPRDIPSLLENGVFPDTYGTIVKRTLFRKLNYNEVYRELEAQIQKVIRTGLRVTHIDGHQHLHMLPKVLPIVLSLAKTYGISCIRIPQERDTFLNGCHNMVRVLGKTGLSKVAAQGLPLVKRMGFKHNEHFWGMINGGNLQEEYLLPILQEVASIDALHELMTHPGANNTILSQAFSWPYHWEEECEAMCSPAVRAFIEDNDIRLVNYGDLA